MKTGLALLLFVATVSAARPRELSVRTGQQETQNAAVKYLRADAALRQSYALGPDAATKLEAALQSPLEAEDEKLVAAADEALIEFEHGASLQHCDWSMSFEDGAFASTAHRGAVRELVAVAGLRARIRFRDGNPNGAMSDALAAMAGARHLSVDGSLASVLFAYKLEKELIEVLGRNLGRLSPAELNELAVGLAALPSGSNISSGFESEKLGRNDFLPAAQAATNRDQLIQELLKRIPVLQSNREKAAEVVDGCGGSVSGFEDCVRQQQSFYASWASRFKLAPDQFERIYKSEIEVVSKSNPIIRIFTPNLPRFRWTQAYCETRRALLNAAIKVRLSGPSSLDQLVDPYDGMPFSYAAVEGGFQLKSRLIDSGSALSLSVAPRKPD